MPAFPVLWEAIVPGSNEIYLRWFIATYKTCLPFMERFGTVDPRVGDPDTLAERLVEEALANRAQGVTAPFASAWAIKSSSGK